MTAPATIIAAGAARSGMKVSGRKVLSLLGQETKQVVVVYQTHVYLASRDGCHLGVFLG